MCAFLFIGAAIAETININWINDGETYAQTTCEIGGDVILPTTPTKRGHTFKGWTVKYTRLEYIESTGTQWIESNIYADNTIGVKIKFQRKRQSDQLVFGTTDDSDRNKIWINWAVYGYISFGDTGIVGYSTDTLEEIEINYLNSRTKVRNGEEIATIRQSINQSNYTMPIFGGRINSNIVSHHFIGKIYSIAFSDDSNIILNLIPAKRNSDNEIGMYDTVSGTFFTNQGTGEFIAGPVAENQNFDE